MKIYWRRWRLALLIMTSPVRQIGEIVKCSNPSAAMPCEMIEGICEKCEYSQHNTTGERL